VVQHNILSNHKQASEWSASAPPLPSNRHPPPGWLHQGERSWHQDRHLAARSGLPSNAVRAWAAAWW